MIIKVRVASTKRTTHRLKLVGNLFLRILQCLMLLFVIMKVQKVVIEPHQWWQMGNLEISQLFF